MRVYLDTEFHEQPGSIELISIGMVRQDGKEYYAVSSDYDESRANGWLAENVLPELPPPFRRKGREVIATEVVSFLDVDQYGSPEFWGFYADYDWVVFCWLFGAMVDLPKGFPMYCKDLKQWADAMGNPRLPKPGSGDRHHALEDARAVRDGYNFLEYLEANEQYERTDARSDAVLGIVEDFADLISGQIKEGAREEHERQLKKGRERRG